MDWSRLLVKKRLLFPDFKPEKGRSPFQQDADRILFSSAFRRLQDKTQVQPLSENDHIRTRLTHSIEVGAVGRSLGTLVGQYVVEEKLGEVNPEEIGYIVQAACYAHDIGNPPFGHAGEKAMQDWFREIAVAANFKSELSEEEKSDFANYDGNAQGFRILTQLENHVFNGGLQLSFPTLGAFLKYPCLAGRNAKSGYIGEKKFSVFWPERRLMEEAASELGLLTRSSLPLSFCRHPLAYIVEAADDICYRIVDVEDGFEIGLIGFAEARDALAAIGQPDKCQGKLSDHEWICYLRAVAINKMIRACVEGFKKNYTSIMAGTHSTDLVSIIDSKIEKAAKAAKELAEEKVYRSERVILRELAGGAAIRGLLDAFGRMLKALRDANWDETKLRGTDRSVRTLLRRKFDGVNSVGDGMYRIFDHVAGTTDRFAIARFQQLTGIKV